MRRSSGKRSTGSLFLICIVCLLVMTGCAATRVQQVWKDENYQEGRLAGVFIVAMVYNPTARMMFESEFAKQFKSRGIKATESFRSIEMETLKGSGIQDVVIAKMKESGSDALLISRVIDVSTNEQIIPGMTIQRGYGMWGTYAGASYSFTEPSAPTTQSYSHERTSLGLETSLFSAKTEKLLWAARSETRVEKSPLEEIKPYVSLIGGKLLGEKMFR